MKNNIKYKCLYLVPGILFLLILASQSNAQTTSADTTKFRFWYSNLDARSMALANATIADPLSSNGLYSNPALLPFSSNPSFTVHSSYNTHQKIISENVTAALYQDNDKELILGTTLFHNSNSKVPLTNTGQLAFTQINFDIAYGQMLTPSLSMGLKLNSIYGSVESGNAFTSNTSLGIIYAPSSSVSYGLVYKGTGYQNEWLGSGISYYSTNQLQTQITTKKLPQRLEIGATLQFPSLAQNPDFILSLSNEKLFGKSGLVYRGGLEIYLLEKLAIQGGYFHSPYSRGGRVGLRLLFDSININYAYANNNLDLTGRTHLLSLSLDI